MWFHNQDQRFVWCLFEWSGIAIESARKHCLSKLQGWKLRKPRGRVAIRGEVFITKQNRLKYYCLGFHPCCSVTKNAFDNRFELFIRFLTAVSTDGAGYSNIVCAWSHGGNDWILLESWQRREISRLILLGINRIVLHERHELLSISFGILCISLAKLPCFIFF